MKKTAAAILTVSLLMLQMSAFAAGYNSYITTAQTVCPVYEPNIVAYNNMNDPKAPARYEGVPNPFIAGSNTLGTGEYDYYKISEGNYCTRLTAALAGGPYIGHSDSHRVSGTITAEFDFKVDNATGKFEVSFLGKNPNTDGAVFSSLLFVDDKNQLSLPGVSDQEAFNKYKNFPTNTWLKGKFKIYLDSNTCSVYLSEQGKEYQEISHMVPVSNPDSYGYTGFRISYYALSTEANLSSCYIDNLLITYDVGYNKDLLKKAFVTKVNSPNAIARTVGIMLDRYGVNVCPTVIDGVRYFPLRFVADCYRAEISYNDIIKEANVVRGEQDIKITDGNITINSQAYTPDAPVKCINDRIYLTAKTLADMLNTNIYFDDQYTMFTDYAQVSETDFNIISALMEE